MTSLDYLARHRAGGAPAFVTAKFETLIDLRDAAKGQLDALQAKVDKARRERADLETERAGLEDSLHGRRFHKQVAQDIERRIERADEALKVASANFDRAWAKLEAASETWNARGQLCRALDYFLRHHGNLEGVEQAESPTPPRPSGAQGWAGALARVREELANVDADAHAVRTAPLPAAEAKDAARRHVEGLAERARPDVRGLVEFGRPIEWPIYPLREAGGAGPAKANLPDARALLAWLHPDQMLAALESEIDAVADDAQAISADEREALLARIPAKKLRAERLEEAIITAAAHAGTVLERRPDADPRAVLGIEAGDNG